MVATAYNMRYGSANTDDVAFGTAAALAGVAGLDCNGVGGRSESVADNAGDGGTAILSHFYLVTGCANSVWFEGCVSFCFRVFGTFDSCNPIRG